MAEEEAGSPELLEDLGEHTCPLVAEGVEEAHNLGAVVVEEVGLLFLVMVEVVEQCPQGEEGREEEVGVERGHLEVAEEGVEVGEMLNQKVMEVEVEELSLSFLVVAEEEVVGERPPLPFLVGDEEVLQLLAKEVVVEVEAAADMNTESRPARSHRSAHQKAR